MTVPLSSGTTGAIPGNGVNNVWPFAFSVASEDEVEVVYTSAVGGTEVIDPGLYSIALINGGRNGGFVTYPLTTARLSDSESITLQLAPDFDQATRLIDQGAYNPEQVERGLDHIVRQTQSLRASVARALLAPPGVAVAIGQPRNQSQVYWDQLADGSFRLTSGSGASASDETTELRVLYADDLGLRGDGTDETATINAKILELSEAGKPCIIYLKSPAGYWPLTDQLKVRSGIGLSMGSPFRATAAGQVGFVGNYAREAAGATVRTATSSGATSIPVTPVSGSVSSNFAVDDQIELSNGQRVRVTALDDGALTLTVTPATTSSLSVGGSIRKLIFSYCSSSWTRHDTPNELAVDDNTKFAVGDIVLVTDDEVTTNADTGSTFELNKEMARVIELGSGTVKLDRSIKHWMTTANRARVVKLNPCRNATLQGATVEFTEAPTSARVETFENSIAWRCQLLACSVPNEDAFGTRGRSFSLSLCYQCDVIDCWSGPAKYKASGEGYGCAFQHSTDCSAVRYTGIGSRHVVSFLASTDCTARQVTGSDWELNLVDWHGMREIGCWAYEVNGIGTARSSQSGLTFGNPSWRAGCYECGVQGGEISDLTGASARGIRVWAVSDDVIVLDVVFRRCTTGIFIRDQSGDGTLHIGKVRVACEFYRVTEPASVDMNSNGSTDEPLTQLDLSGSRFIDFASALFVDSVDDFIAKDVVLRTAIPTTDAYAIDIRRSGAAWLDTVTFDGCQKHIRLEDTPAMVIDSRVRNPGTAAWIDELSASPVTGDVYDHGLFHPPTWTPARVSAQTNLYVHSRPGML